MELNPQVDGQLPPLEHLLNWGLEIFEDDLTILANPASVPDHAYLKDNEFLTLLLQYQARYYEKILEVAFYQSCAENKETLIVKNPLVPALPSNENFEVSAGHYSIGAKKAGGFAEEYPPQIIDLSRFRLKTDPVSNAEYLAFLIDNGYQNTDFWSEAGKTWLKNHQDQLHPLAWRKDAQGRWFAMGIKGAFELLANEPVTGLCKHEAEAYINWAKTQNKAFEGAVLPHEYQWEVAVKTQALKNQGRIYEWCANELIPYDQYKAPETPEMENPAVGTHATTLRGASMHTQPCLRRVSFRSSANANYQHPFAGMRVVFPPGAAFWDKQ
jgi:iron(II)-dependent oxidoreductase